MKSFEGRSILIVDDEEDIRDILMDTFSYHHATVIGAENGKKGLELLKQRKFDVVISDVRMPDGDGVHLIKNLNQIESEVKPQLYLCSGFNDLSDEDAKKLNVIQVFSKPFDLDEIIEVVSKNI